MKVIEGVATFEFFISAEGLLGTRLKTLNGCPRYTRWMKRIQKRTDDELFDMLYNKGEE